MDIGTKISDVDLAVTSLGRSVEFDLGLLEPLGWRWIGRARPGDYAVFFHDPDGIKLELLHRPGNCVPLGSDP